MIVIDASAAVALLLDGPDSDKVWRRVFADRQELQATEVIDLEVAQTLRRLCATHRLTEQRASQALDDFGSLRLRRHPHLPLIGRIWSLRHNLSAYDASYVALAEYLDAPLLTKDSRLANAPGHAAQVELV